MEELHRDDGFEATFVVSTPSEAWKRLHARRRRRSADDRRAVVDPRRRGSPADELEVVPESTLRVLKADEPCKGTEIVITMEDAETGTRITFAQFGFGSGFTERRAWLESGLVADPRRPVRVLRARRLAPAPRSPVGEPRLLASPSRPAACWSPPCSRVRSAKKPACNRVTSSSPSPAHPSSTSATCRSSCGGVVREPRRRSATSAPARSSPARERSNEPGRCRRRARSATRTRARPTCAADPAVVHDLVASHAGYAG